jgi:ATP-binding cassette, subfamily A (ABC1), member 3
VVKKLAKTYLTGKRAVDEISFKVSQGEVFGLLGVNGAGKSSTFKMLSGENKPTSGSCWVSGYISDDPEARK